VSRRGPYFTTLVHLGHIYSQPYPQYSKVSRRTEDGKIVLSVGGWYEVSFRPESGRLQVVGISYRMREGH